MRILITGGAGFVGSHLAESLLYRGDDVFVIDNYRTGRRDSFIPHERMQFVEGSIADTETVQAAFNRFKPEVVVHAAASYHDSADWQEDARTNVSGTINVVQEALKNESRRLIYFQTALCYGLKPLQQPVTLDHPLMLEGSSYAISKTTGERYIALSGLDYVSFRLANCYGPRAISGPMATFFQRVKNNKPCFAVDTRRDFVFVTDLLDCVIKAIDGQGRCGAYHVSSGRDFAIAELYDAVVAAMDAKTAHPLEHRKRSPDDAPTILLDPSETERDFDWQVNVDLKEGVRAAVEYYEQFGVMETYTHLRYESKNDKAL